jgi:hypothetical protein
MTKTRLFTPLFVLAFLALANPAFAQLNCGVGSTPVSRATDTGHTEQAGDLIFTCAAGATATTAATITINYGVPITNNTNAAFSVPVQIADTAGWPGGLPTVTDAQISNTTGQIVVAIPAQPAPAASSFTMKGVLVTLNGSGRTRLDATVSVSPGNNVLITAGQDVATVITSIVPGINTTTTPPTVTSALYFSTTGTAAPGRSTFTITVTENYIDMFRDLVQNASAEGPAPAGDTELLFTFTGLATAMNVGGCTASIAPAGPTVTLVSPTITPTSNTLRVRFDNALPPNLTAVETVSVSCNTLILNVGGTTPLPLSTPITATVTLAPTGNAFGTNNAVLLAGATVPVPRFAANNINLGTVLSFTPNTTTFIIPFAVGDPATVQPAGAFDTGIAFANTTGETVGGTGIFPIGKSQAQAGPITFNFFPSDGSSAFAYTTASIASGASYISNTSEILRAAGRTTPFLGYIIGIANFTNGHGVAYVYGGSATTRLTSETPVLVIASPIVAARTANNMAEQPGVEFTTR